MPHDTEPTPRQRLITAIREFRVQFRTSASPGTRWLAEQLGYSQSGICYLIDAMERDRQISVDRSGYRNHYIIKEKSA